MDERPVESTIYSLSEKPPEAPLEDGEADRHVTLYRVGSVNFEDNRRELCLIKDISAGGMTIRIYCDMHLEMQLSVELKSGSMIKGSVFWIRGKNVGVRFDQPIDIIEILKASMEGQQPRMARVKVECFASVRQGATVHWLHACDVSQGGIKVEASPKLEPNSDVVIKLPGAPPLQGVVRWVGRGFCGITFNRVISLSELVNWLHEQREQISRSETSKDRKSLSHGHENTTS